MTDTQAQGLGTLPPCPECESEYTGTAEGLVDSFPSGF
ncbi:hypothetical protein FRC0493_01113 [Corynebacterium diphtheriae]|nr:hypothetical protein CIP101841_01154 [Corynebacterium diphtheriae]CAB0647490.1 hypothetical protein CIP107566_01142 [Corynebacterium diphtheriae]CAB0991553.1 hypothetical protein FRC0493_01113 [Corynebacterium diphtheriae]